MYTVTFSAGAIFVLGILTGLVISAIGLVAAAFSTNKKNK